MAKSIFDRIGAQADNAVAGLTAARMDYLVRRVAAKGDPEGNGNLVEIPKAFGLWTSKGTFLANAVGDEYRVVQHAEQMQVMDALVAQGKAKLRTVGSLSERTAFAWADLPIITEVRPGDPVQWGLLMTSSHGATANHAFLMAERPACKNVMPRLYKGGVLGLKVTLRHSGDVQQKLHRVSQMLEAALNQVNVEHDMWRQLAGKKISKADALALVRQWTGAEEAAKLGDRDKVAKLEMQAEHVCKLADTSPGSKGDSSLWELLNGMTFFLDHAQARYARSIAAAKRFAASTLDGVQGKKRDLALAMVQAKL